MRTILILLAAICCCGCVDLTIDRYYAFEQWLVYWNAGDNNQFFRATELIDALFNAIA